MTENYTAYMLRLWCSGCGQADAWRASLEDPHTGEVHAFASVAALLAFLETLTKNRPAPGVQLGDVGSPEVPPE